MLALLYCCVAVAISLCVSAPLERKFLKEHTRFDPASFSRCHSDRVLLDAITTCTQAEVALMDGTCSDCGNMTISVLRSRLQYLEETGAPLNIP